MANPTVQPGFVPANTPASINLIPTLFAQLHAEIEACDDREQLVDASTHLNGEIWSVSPWAHRRLNEAMRDRCHQIWRAEA